MPLPAATAVRSRFRGSLGTDLLDSIELPPSRRRAPVRLSPRRESMAPPDDPKDAASALRVTDRRRFTETGDMRDGDDAPEAAPATPTPRGSFETDARAEPGPAKAAAPRAETATGPRPAGGPGPQPTSDEAAR